MQIDMIGNADASALHFVVKFLHNCFQIMIVQPCFLRFWIHEITRELEKM